MHREDVLDILDKIPKEDLTKTILTLRGGGMITIDQIGRTEDDYLIVRGREGGSNDEGRAFFVPFDEILYVKLDRVVGVYEIKRMYGEKADAPDALSEHSPIGGGKSDTRAADGKSAQQETMDPAAIAKQNLLARIRAAKSIAGKT
jgi:hypothetical protein